MDSTMMGGLGAFLGSIIGGGATLLSTWVAQKSQRKREDTRVEVEKRERLYAEFIAECSTLMTEAFQSGLENTRTFANVMSVYNRIRLISSRPIVIAAEDVFNVILKQYFQPNMTVEDFLQLSEKHREDENPLFVFVEICRTELEALRRSGEAPG